jgi:hypothetical protein
MQAEVTAQIQREMQTGWRIGLEDLLAFLILLLVALGATAYFQHLIASGLENAEYISTWFARP